MLKALAAPVAVLVAVLPIPAFAAPPADQDACNNLAFSLAEKVAAKKLPQADAVKVDEMLAKLEGQCGAGKLAEADATAKAVEAALAK
jgi:hypothetical protein